MTQDYDTLIEKLRPSQKTSEPYYSQMKRKIEALIESGEFYTGIGLPSERVLAETLQISRTTVRRCYEALRGTGQIDSNGRGGTKVRASTLRSIQTLAKLKNFSEEMRDLGVTATTRIESHDILHDRTIAEIFQRPTTASFLRLVQVHLGDNVPIARETAWYDLSLAPALADWDASGAVYTFLEQHCAIKLKVVEQSIEAVMSAKEEAKLFNLPEATPGLLIKRKAYSEQNQLVEYVEGAFRADAYAYRQRLAV